MTDPRHTPEFVAAVTAVLDAPGSRVIVELTDEQVGMLDDQAATLKMRAGDYAQQLLVTLLTQVDREATAAAEQLPKPTQH